jgi:hypothetical protein
MWEYYLMLVYKSLFLFRWLHYFKLHSNWQVRSYVSYTKNDKETVLPVSDYQFLSRLLDFFNIYIYLFIFGLFNDSLRSAGYTASNGRTMNA